MKARHPLRPIGLSEPAKGHRVSRTSNTYSLTEVGAILGIRYRQVRRLIQQGQLRGRNVAAPGAKPRWVVTHQALTAIKKRRAK